jgi:hypothetical protein
VLLVGWLAVLGYYVLRVTLWAKRASCPDTVWESGNDPACEWTTADVVWYSSVPFLAAVTLLTLVVSAFRRVRRSAKLRRAVIEM